MTVIRALLVALFVGLLYAASPAAASPRMDCGADECVWDFGGNSRCFPEYDILCYNHDDCYMCTCFEYESYDCYWDPV